MKVCSLSRELGISFEYRVLIRFLYHECFLFRMQINHEMIKRIAKNSRLNLSEKEEQEFLPQLEEVLKKFSELNDLYTADCEPTFHPAESALEKEQFTNRSREDFIKRSLSQEQALRNTKNKKDGYFKGPKAV